MPQLHAQPLNNFTEGFYFSSFEAFQEKAVSPQNLSYEIQFIEGDAIDAKFFNTLSITQTNLEAYFDACETWHEDYKISIIICVDECGYQFHLGTDHPEQFDLDLYEMESMEELAHTFVEEGLFGEIPERLRFYIDFEAIARDLSVDYCETVICGRRLIYRCV